ncbi:zinc finger CW-type PWWP domain protein 2 [Tachyglossus aculeatus]|uniref:zinc finger CW-type PWWP domain protein 2 n=1 Tax=Tachyglossus aculeatus TaxID=9261 RepID=UPI0018F2B401|nr:zinc finger CW-type PWWP domain protein 2 [Tachyglossus aculeatus]XP_038625715.1 zinc finger CW-type PWWP domain protein 2 [Tachyglossus aculeatus]XP_038625723.1 zinc finger CW-type PWWP domain protein 2 [Tachyglossus aculeatus]XP_038625732.1 zinc finger CW-type PWWP domain protein 2 [Tachyglossus aculeatus]
MNSSVKSSFYEGKVWFQCENESCLKWRLLSSEDAARVDQSEPWFCFMNTDPNYNACSVSEENFPEESQFYESGYKFVYSQFPIGSLVLVKLYYWPSWPGILCLDSLKGKYVTYDLDGNVDSYHVEFLGDPHSRSWIKATNISHYSASLKAEECKSEKQWYESAMQEASLLYAFSCEQRLDMCCQTKQETLLVDGTGANVNGAVIGKKRVKATTNSSGQKPCILGKNKRKRICKSSFESACSDGSLSKENLVISESEVMLKDLEQMLQQVEDPFKNLNEAGVHGDEINAGETLAKCGTNIWEESLLENPCEEDCLVIGDITFRAGECIENISNTFKEIDNVMSEFQDI